MSLPFFFNEKPGLAIPFVFLNGALFVREDAEMFNERQKRRYNLIKLYNSGVISYELLTKEINDIINEHIEHEAILRSKRWKELGGSTCPRKLN